MNQADSQGSGGGGLPAAAVRDGVGARRGPIGCALLAMALVAIGVGALMWSGVLRRGPAGGSGASAPTGASPAISAGEQQVADAERKLDLLRDELDHKLVPAIAKLQSDRDDVKAKLKEQGIADSKGLKDNFKAQSLGQELAEVVGLIRVMETKRAAYERSSFELESLVRRLKRKNVAEDAGLSEQEMAEVTTTLKTIDAQLADVTQAPPELNPSQFDALIDEELGAATLDGRISHQIDLRQTRLDKLHERSVALHKAAEETDARVADVENFRVRLERAYQSALDEDRWPVKAAGRTFDRVSAENAMARAKTYEAAQKDVPAAAAPLISKVDEAAGVVEKELAELKGLGEQAKGLATADPRTAEIKSRLSALVDGSVDVSKDSLLAPADILAPFDPMGK